MDIQTFNILRLERKPSGPLITYVKSDFDESALKKSCSNVRSLSRSDEYSVFSCSYRQYPLNFMATGSGSASLLTGLFEVYSSNLSAIVRVGACGGLNDTKVGEVVLSDLCICKDRVSSVLANSAQVLADEGLTNRIKSRLSHDHVAASVKHVVSVDAMYLFEEDIDNGEKNGACCWDLETATLLAFGRKFGVKAASMLEVVSDRRGRSSDSYPPIRRLDFVRSIMELLAEGLQFD